MVSYMSDCDDPAATLEDALRKWAAKRETVDDERDPLIRAAFAGGISKQRIHTLTKIARTTIDDILTPGNAASAKTPTASGISRLLGAEHTRAVVRLRGGRSGFTVADIGDGIVWVEYFASISSRTGTRCLEMLAGYAKTIRDAGYTVETSTERKRLTVTAKTPASQHTGDPA